MLPVVSGLAAFGTKVGGVVVTNLPQILTVGGIGSMVIGGCLIVRDVPYYIEVLEAAKKDEITKSEAAKRIISKGAKAGLLIASGIIWIGVGVKVSLDRAAAAVAAGAYANKKLELLREENKTQFGVEAAQKIDQRVAEKMAVSEPGEWDPDLSAEKRTGMIRSTREGTGPWIACKEQRSGRLFKIRLGALLSAPNDAQVKLAQGLMLTENDWYDCLGLPSLPGGEFVAIHADCVGRGLALADGEAEMDHDCVYPLRVVRLINAEWEQAYRAAR